MTIKLLKILAGPEGCHDIGAVLTMNPKKEKAFVKDGAAEYLPENHPRYRPYVGKGKETATDKGAEKAAAEAKAKAEALAAAEDVVKKAEEACDAAKVAAEKAAAAAAAAPKDSALADAAKAAADELERAEADVKTTAARLVALANPESK